MRILNIKGGKTVKKLNIKEKKIIESFIKLSEATVISNYDKKIRDLETQFRDLLVMYDFIELEEIDISKVKLNIFIGDEIVGVLDFKIDQESKKHVLHMKTMETHFIEDIELFLDLAKNCNGVFAFFPRERVNHFNIKPRVCSDDSAEFYLKQLLRSIMNNRLYATWETL